MRLVEAVSSWRPGQSGAAAAVQRLVALGIAPDRATVLASAAAPFQGRAEATSGVISAQYGGLTATSAAILVTST